jgi:hypothetical protein
MTFSPCCNISTRQFEWAMYHQSQFRGVYSCVQIASHYRQKYADDVKTVTFS